MDAPTQPDVDWDDFDLERRSKYPRRFRFTLATEAEVFRWIVAACASVDYTGTTQQYPAVRVRFFGGSDRPIGDPSRWLPRTDDESVAGYTRRIQAERGGRFGVVINNLQSVDHDLCARVREFLAPYHALNGIRSEIDLSVFLGNYERTPFGVHQDSPRESAFSFVVSGRKRMRFWPDARVHANPDLLRALRLFDRDYADHVDASVHLDGEPGDVLYWPGDAWHVAEALDDRPHLSLSLLMVSQQGFTLREMMARSISRALDRIVPGSVAPRPGEPLPDDLVHETTDAVLRALAAELRTDVKKRWVSARATRGVTRTPPTLDGAVLLETDRVVGDADGLVRATDGDQSLLGTYASVLQFGNAPGVDALIEDLCGEAPWTVADLIRRHDSDHDADDLKHVLDELYRAGSLRRL